MIFSVLTATLPYITIKIKPKMNNLLEKLEKRFNTLVEIDDDPSSYSLPKFPPALADYLLFIKETSPFNTISRKTDKPFIISSLYKDIEELLQKYGDIPKILPSPYSLRWNLKTIKPSLLIFHQGILQKATSQKLFYPDDKPRLITKDGRGDFFYDGRIITMPKDTIYYQVFDATYSRANQDGLALYEDIEEYLVKCGRSSVNDEDKRNKRIINAVYPGQGLFRYAKVNGKCLKNKTPGGKKLIEIIRGKGLKLNNPFI